MIKCIPLLSWCPNEEWMNSHLLGNYLLSPTYQQEQRHAEVEKGGQDKGNAMETVSEWRVWVAAPWWRRPFTISFWYSASSFSYFTGASHLFVFLVLARIHSSGACVSVCLYVCLSLEVVVDERIQFVVKVEMYNVVHVPLNEWGEPGGWWRGFHEKVNKSEFPFQFQASDCNWQSHPNCGPREFNLFTDPRQQQQRS